MVWTATQPGGQPPGTTRALALVGFYRGVDLIEPGQVIDLPRNEFLELRTYHKVTEAPAQPVVEEPRKPKAKAE